MHRAWAVGVVVALVAVLGASGYLLVHKNPVAQAGQTPGYVVSPLPTPSASASGSATSGSPSSSGTPSSGRSGTPTHTSAASIAVAFLGDDYTQGVGATSSGKRFTTLVAAALKVKELNYGVDGTGYAKASSSGKAYGDRLSALVAARPAVVVVSGGRNDISDDLSTFTTAAASLFAALHAQLPDAVLVAVAPFWGDSAPPDGFDALGTAVKAGVTAVGGTYLDIPDPLRGHSDWMSDDADPDDAGYAAIGAAVTSALAPVVPAQSVRSATPSSTPTGAGSGSSTASANALPS